MSLILLPNSGGELIDPRTGRPFAADTTELKLPHTFGCEAHARQAARAGVENQELWAKALLELLFYNPRFAAACGWSKKTRKKLNLQQANAGLQRIGPLCCFLSGPERRKAIALAQDPDQLVELHRKRQALFQTSLVAPQ